jgi:hypothetical protein
MLICSGSIAYLIIANMDNFYIFLNFHILCTYYFLYLKNYLKWKEAMNSTDPVWDFFLYVTEKYGDKERQPPYSFHTSRKRYSTRSLWICPLITLAKTLKKKLAKVVAQACYPSYSGGRDWEDHGLRTVQTKS